MGGGELQEGPEGEEQVLIWPTDQLAHTELGWLEDGHGVPRTGQGEGVLAC